MSRRHDEAGGSKESEAGIESGTTKENVELSDTHVIAVTRRDNGELAEDVVAKESIEEDGSVTDHQSDRVIEVLPAPEVPGRAHPSEPVPGTLPTRRVGPSRR